MNMTFFFNNYIYPIVEFLKCINNKMEDPHYALYLIDDGLLDEKKTELDVCLGDFNVTDPYCFKKCRVNFYNVGIKMNFLRNFKQALMSKSIFLLTQSYL